MRFPLFSRACAALAVAGLVAFVGAVCLQSSQALTLKNCIVLLDDATHDASENGAVKLMPLYFDKTVTGIAYATPTSGSTPTLDVKIQTCRTTTASSWVSGRRTMVDDGRGCTGIGRRPIDATSRDPSRSSRMRLPGSGSGNSTRGSPPNVATSADSTACITRWARRA